MDFIAVTPPSPVGSIENPGPKQVSITSTSRSETLYPVRMHGYINLGFITHAFPSLKTMDLHGIFHGEEDDFFSPKRCVQYVEVTEYMTKLHFCSGWY